MEEKECEWFYRNIRQLADGQLSKPFYLVFTTIEDKQFEYVNIGTLEVRCNEIFKFLTLHKKFNELFERSNEKLYSFPEAYKLDGFEFTTLAEVEKALNNKAFL